MKISAKVGCLGGATGTLLPVEEQFAVAVGEAGGPFDVEFGQGAVYPVWWAFQLGIVSNGGLVDDEMGYGVGDGIELGTALCGIFRR